MQKVRFFSRIPAAARSRQNPFSYATCIMPNQGFGSGEFALRCRLLFKRSVYVNIDLWQRANEQFNAKQFQAAKDSSEQLLTSQPEQAMV